MPIEASKAQKHSRSSESYRLLRFVPPIAPKSDRSTSISTSTSRLSLSPSLACGLTEKSPAAAAVGSSPPPARCLGPLESARQGRAVGQTNRGAAEASADLSRDSDPDFDMLLGSDVSTHKTLYEVLSVSEDATYDEIRVAYKSAALNTHPDKAHTTLKSFVSSNEQHEFFSVQKAWEILRYPKSRAEYDKQLQSSRENLEIIASEIEIEDMIIESTADAVELLYPCRCGDYFSITSCELGELGILVSEDGGIELQASDSVSASVVLGCGSCSLKTRLVINKT